MYKVPPTNKVPYQDQVILGAAKEPDNFLKYMKMLIKALQDMYITLANAINNNADLVTGYRVAVDNDATPDVKNTRFLIVNYSSNTTITNFDNGESGQKLYVLQISGAGTITLDDGANIKTNTDADKNMTAERVYSFCNYGGVWYEVE